MWWRPFPCEAVYDGWQEGETGRMEAQNTTSVGVPISFPPNLYEGLERLAKEKKVSRAWVVRDAVEKFVTDESATGERPTRRAT